MQHQPPPSKIKLDELFFHWISLPETQTLVRSLLDDLKAGRPLPSPDKNNASHAALSPKAAFATPHAAVVYSPTKSPYSPHSPFATQGSAYAPLSPNAQQLAPPRSPTPKSPSARSPPRVSLNFQDFGNVDKLQSHAVPSKTLIEKEDDKPASKPQVKRKREIIPPFYFPSKSRESQADANEILAKIRAAFTPFPDGITNSEDLLPLTKNHCGLPSFLNPILFSRIDKDNTGSITLARFLEYWKQDLGPYDRPQRFFRVLKQPKNDFLCREDFKPMMSEILATHPGLEFLEATPEFQERYADTVIIRIFYMVNRSGRGRISLKEFLESNLFQACCQLDEEEDVNAVTEYFSYEHFYVIYCKFWELDSDHNFLIDKKELMRYSNHSLTFNIVERIFEQAGRRFIAGTPPGMMGYEDFAWFLLSEEDKSTETSLEYWFRCVDLEGKGCITALDMRFFYQEQMHRMECLAQEVVPFEDVCCQMFDMLHPTIVGKITLKDLKRCKTAGILFNVLFNLNKFLAWEQRDPFLARQEQLSELSEWDRFARFEYARLCMDEEAPIEQGQNSVLNPFSHESPF
mmetsp:Transcript_27528/g.44795  ORF Transcript_27528/g.44795 Transcript_27528/m.44795 type:complete len:574 (+) Transcript_27528:137-1858(+)|eukprot:CAMPEP_0184649524 /NCGR_PEP_ID=MMETSP0308-20130426/6922_1 /TAXON_ID=38269 /ORGANISM="Gloeochaete witrockiana, Strain SAG 46.84" /LENGTH=573 /DNA_ID=CAMNT_0027082341 /DNA_START=136 /DNA_END=1857 /DNA_ORIENTATION=-